MSEILVEKSDHVAWVTLNRPERKNPLTFDSYAELRDTFRALAVTPFPGGKCAAPALAENQFLVDAIAAAPAPKTLFGSTRSRRSAGEKLIWVLELFETLEERERTAMQGQPGNLVSVTDTGG